jgi:hypothetical protein
MKLRPIDSPAYRALVRQSFTVRRVVGKAIPDALSIRARAALGLMRLRTIDLGRLELIRRAPLAQLREAAYLEHELLPALGLSGDAAELFPDELRPSTGSGLHHWQYPSQFSKYLVAVAARPVDSYMEIGVQHGGTFAITVEYLQRFQRLRAAYAIDVNRVPSLKQYARQNPIVRVLREDSSSDRFAAFVRQHGPFGLVLIDGDHSEAACRRDFESVVGRAAMIALHDIVDEGWPGVRRVWEEIKRQGDRFECHEFIDQYVEVQRRWPRPALGIGLAISRS